MNDIEEAIEILKNRKLVDDCYGDGYLLFWNEKEKGEYFAEDIDLAIETVLQHIQELEQENKELNEENYKQSEWLIQKQKRIQELEQELDNKDKDLLEYREFNRDRLNDIKEKDKKIQELERENNKLRRMCGLGTDEEEQEINNILTQELTRPCTYIEDMFELANLKAKNKILECKLEKDIEELKELKNKEKIVLNMIRIVTKIEAKQEILDIIKKTEG